MIEYSAGLKLGITVVDNASSDDTVAAIQTNFSDVRVIVNKKNLGYAAAVNIGANTCDAPFLLISNSDVFYHEDSIHTLYEYIKSDPEIALTGPQQEYPDGSWQYSFGYLPGRRLILNNYLFLNTLISMGRKILFKLEMSHDKPKPVEYIDGAVHFVRKADFDALGGFDEDYFFYTEEADFCKRLHDAGRKVMFQPEASVTHIRGGSSSGNTFDAKSAEMFIGSKILYCEKHLSESETERYIKSEIFATGILNLVWQILKLPITILKNNSVRDSKIEMFRLLRRVWKRKLDEIED
jgi:GT2 family glycosyltransferase